MTKSVLLIITGGIAAYKSLELIRLIRKEGWTVRCVLTESAQQFVTPMSISALCEHPAYTDLWSLKDEAEMGHIRLSREADMIVVAPATANFVAKAAHGLADDLASTTLLASDKPAIFVPAMNIRMWENPATQRNIEQLKADGHSFIGPDDGDMACGEYGPGRMVEPENIMATLKRTISAGNGVLSGYKALVTSGPTYEPIDPVRFIGNRSSGKQGHALAQALANFGADVTMVTGPVTLPDPNNVKTIHVNTADEMFSATRGNWDIAICAAAVSDWAATKQLAHKMKKRDNEDTTQIAVTKTPDILKDLSSRKNRPHLVIGFAAETENLLDNARQKITSKGCDWIIANAVGMSDNGEERTFGKDENHAVLISHHTEIDFGRLSKQALAAEIVKKIGETLNHDNITAIEAAK